MEQDYWRRLTRLAGTMPLPALSAQLTTMGAWREAVRHGRLPRAPLPRLGVDAGMYASLVMQPHADLRDIRTVDHLLRNFRQYIAYHYGMWAFVQQQLFTVWHDLFGRLRYLEVAAGNGYISAGLQAVGNHAIATDTLSWTAENETGRRPLVPIHRANATAALWQYGNMVDAVVMAWSPDRDANDVHFLFTLRHCFPQLRFFVIGERNGATNSALFWQLARFVPDRRLLPLNRAYPQFDAINDRIYLMH